MRLRSYLLLALAAFAMAVTGSDVVAKMDVSGMPLAEAFKQHVEWASLSILGVFFLICTLCCSRAGLREGE
jgi:hypothetical protein